MLSEVVADNCTHRLHRLIELGCSQVGLLFDLEVVVDPANGQHMGVVDLTKVAGRASAKVLKPVSVMDTLPTMLLHVSRYPLFVCLCLLPVVSVCQFDEREHGHHADYPEDPADQSTADPDECTDIPGKESMGSQPPGLRSADVEVRQGQRRYYSYTGGEPDHVVGKFTSLR